MPRKKRSDCKLNRLSDEQRDAVFALAQRESLEAVCDRVERDFDFSVSRQALSLWLAGERLARKVERQVRIADAVAAAAREANGGTLDAALDAVVKARALDAIQSEAEPDALVELVKCVISMRKTEQDSRRLALLEKRAALADKVEEAAKNPKLTPEELTAKLKTIFGW